MAVSSRFRAAGLSDQGRKRENNEDRFHVDADRGIFFVIDGVGGQAAGEKAAGAALEVVKARLERQIGTVEERIREAIAVANNEIFRLAAGNPEWEGMACVLTIAVLDGPRVVVGHVGDSRLYLVSGNNITKLTHDHSPVGEREDRGEIGEHEAMQHPRRNEVFRDVGSQPHSPDDPDFIELLEHPFPPDCALLLCSDGLSDLVPSREIHRVVSRQAGRPELAASELIRAANQAGGKDNITVILVEGSEFAASQAASAAQVVSSRGSATAPPPESRFRWVLAAFAGVVVAALLLFFLKPHWVTSAEGNTFGFGVVRTPATWNVGQNGIPTIAAALGQAAAGDIVVVAPGRYREQVVLKTGVEIRASVAGESIIDADGIAVLADAVTGARVSGLRIAGDQVAVGVQLNNSNVELSGLQIVGARQTGVEVRGTSEALLMASTIANNQGAGVIVRDTAAPRLLHNVISGNGKSSRRPGLEILDNAQPIVAGNMIWGNGAEPIWAHAKAPLPDLERHNFFGPGEPPRGQAKVKVPR